MKYQHILVALELSEESQVLLQRASYMAKQHEAHVSFVHIDGSHGEIYPELVDIHNNPQQSPLHKETMDQLHGFEESFELPLKHFFVGTGDLADKLEATIGDNGIDLLICGHHHDFWSRIISYSKHLIHKSPVDILVVPINP
ncbi:universal stress global response regulator UspA [Vibrio sp. qd031]|uniref:universal stress protein n=1 Tax=Vibrio sp. qd031 TaxID=1603038 RepID=UPI000A10F5E5|nr:universal stress protein [Vibrio sp. qd031]ORT50964.1 universal stress global response regulator UspA [Vibrio sp. qd031]